MTSALNSTVHQRGAASPAPRRKRLSTTERLALLERENARCHLCGGEIQPGQAWDVNHEIPLELGGADDDENRRAAHRFVALLIRCVSCGGITGFPAAPGAAPAPGEEAGGRRGRGGK